MIRTKIGPDDEFALYKLTYMEQEHYCIGADIADVMEGYEDKSGVTRIELIDTCYISPSILKFINK